MAERRVLVKAFAGRYQKATKKERGVILNEFVLASGYNRRYAAWLLRSHGKRVRLGRRWIVVGDASRKVKRRRPRLYGPEVAKVLIRLWVMLDYPASRRLVAALPGVVEALERHGELALAADVRAKLFAISPATVDRLLAEEKKRYVLKSRAKTKPDKLFRHLLPVQTWAEVERGQPGHLQVDLVGHDGGQARGDFLWTLTLTGPPRGGHARSPSLHPRAAWPPEPPTLGPAKLALARHELDGARHMPKQIPFSCPGCL